MLITIPLRISETNSIPKEMAIPGGNRILIHKICVNKWKVIVQRVEIAGQDQSMWRSVPPARIFSRTKGGACGANLEIL